MKTTKKNWVILLDKVCHAMRVHKQQQGTVKYKYDKQIKKHTTDKLGIYIQNRQCK